MVVQHDTGRCSSSFFAGMVPAPSFFTFASQEVLRSRQESEHGLIQSPTAGNRRFNRIAYPCVGKLGASSRLCLSGQTASRCRSKVEM